MAEGLENTTKPITSNKDVALKLIDGALNDSAIIENWIKEVRDKFGAELHPWSLHPLANAIGAVQACQSHLKSAKHHIETPNPPIDAEFQVIKDY